MSNEDICPAWRHSCAHSYEYECDAAASSGTPCAETVRPVPVTTNVPAPDLQALRVLAENATLPPWSKVIDENGKTLVVREFDFFGDQHEIVTGDIGDDDAEFIAAANPATILALIAGAVSRDAEIAELRQAALERTSKYISIGARAARSAYREDADELSSELLEIAKALKLAVDSDRAALTEKGKPDPGSARHKFCGLLDCPAAPTPVTEEDQA